MKLRKRPQVKIIQLKESTLWNDPRSTHEFKQQECKPEIIVIFIRINLQGSNLWSCVHFCRDSIYTNQTCEISYNPIRIQPTRTQTPESASTFNKNPIRKNQISEITNFCKNSPSKTQSLSPINKNPNNMKQNSENNCNFL